jgi:hypothetical protein
MLLLNIDSGLKPLPLLKKLRQKLQKKSNLGENIMPLSTRNLSKIKRKQRKRKNRRRNKRKKKRVDLNSWVDDELLISSHINNRKLGRGSTKRSTSCGSQPVQFATLL